MANSLSTVTLSVAARDDVTARAIAAFHGEPQGARISFASVDLLWQTLTRERWALLQAMTGQGAMTLVEAARRAGREPEAIAADAQVLLDAGVLDRAGDRIVFPFDAVHVEFTLTKAA